MLSSGAYSVTGRFSSMAEPRRLATIGQSILKFGDARLLWTIIAATIAGSTGLAVAAYFGLRVAAGLLDAHGGYQSSRWRFGVTAPASAAVMRPSTSRMPLEARSRISICSQSEASRGLLALTRALPKFCSPPSHDDGAYDHPRLSVV
jgi:hypothetical protein